MNHEKYLKDKASYEDRYDRHTVEQCLWLQSELIEDKKKDEKNAGRIYDIMYILATHTRTGERYLNRQKTVQEWMDRDRRRDERFENAVEPSHVLCKFCNKSMVCADKDLRTDYEKDCDRIRFYFHCKPCQVMKEIYDDGEVIDVIPWKCPKCSGRLTDSSKRTETTLTLIDECSSCGYRDVKEYDFSAKAAEREKTAAEEERIYRINKDRFCLSDKDGQAYLAQRISMDLLSKTFNHEKLGKGKQAPPLKKYTIIQVEKLLKEALEKEGFVKFAFGQPDTKRDIMVPFTVQDTSDRTDYVSRKALKKLVCAVVDGTNWKLMSDGADYRLGILTGRLKGLERESEFSALDGDINSATTS